MHPTSKRVERFGARLYEAVSGNWSDPGIPANTSDLGMERTGFWLRLLDALAGEWDVGYGSDAYREASRASLPSATLKEFRTISKLQLLRKAMKEHLLAAFEQPGRPSQVCVLFVHDFSDKDGSSWGEFPRLLFENRRVDVGLYRYGHHRAFSSVLRRTTIESESWNFARLLVDSAASYQRVVVVGHSMGGLLIVNAIDKLVRDQSRLSEAEAALRGTAGIFLLAAPEGVQTLDPFHRVAKEGWRFRPLLTPDSAGERREPFHIQTYVALATEDVRLSALTALGASTRRLAVMRGTHETIARPSSRNDEVFRWFRQRLDECLAAAGIDASLAEKTSGMTGTLKVDRAAAVTIRASSKLLKEVIEAVSSIRTKGDLSIEVDISDQQFDR